MMKNRQPWLKWGQNRFDVARYAYKVFRVTRAPRGEIYRDDDKAVRYASALFVLAELGKIGMSDIVAGLEELRAE